MVTGRALGDGELGGYLAVGEAPGDEEHNLQLSRVRLPIGLALAKCSWAMVATA